MCAQGEVHLSPQEHCVFIELGDEIGAAAAAATEAARAACAAPCGGKRNRQAVARFDPVDAERGGGGWGKYDKGRIGRRHGRVREDTYEELASEARELRTIMAAIKHLVTAPDRSPNAVMERLASIVLEEAASEPQDSATSSEAAGSPAVGGETVGGETAVVEEADTEAAGRNAVAGEVEESGGDNRAPLQSEPVKFTNVICSGAPACQVEISSRAMRITEADGKTCIDGVPRALPLELIVNVRAIHKVLLSIVYIDNMCKCTIFLYDNFLNSY